jgi:ABC-2 type transport system ATP-binding protein
MVAVLAIMEKEEEGEYMLLIQDIKKQYNRTHALKGVSLHIPKGVCFGLVGPNGAGKTTLIKILASVIQDFEGNVQFDSKNIQRTIGYVPQEICMELTLTALDNLYFFGKLYGLKGRALKTRAQEVLGDIGLAEHAKDKVLTFSGGMKRRLNIGCALMHNPKIIIMDEPTVGIDPQSRRYIFQMIERLKQEECTIIYASHYMEEIEQLCDEVAMIDQGEIVEHGKIAVLLQKYSVPSVYVSGKNCLPEDLDQFCDVEQERAGYLLKTKNPISIMERILTYAKANQGQLIRLELVQPRLEEVFFSLTGSQLRD